MTVYRKARPEDRAHYLEFINLVFSMAHRPHDFRTLLPKVYDDGRDADEMQNIAVDDAGKIRGLVAVLPGEMHILGETLRTGYVGSVSVHPYARGEGYMKALMQMAINGAIADGMDIMMLSGQRQRYEYFGFTRGGLGLSYLVTATNLRHALGGVDASAFSFVPMQDAEPAIVERAIALHEAQDVRMHRDREDFVRILESWNARPFVVLRAGEFAGYIVASADLGGISEIQLSDEALYAAAIKGWMGTQACRQIRISAAAYDAALNRALKGFAEEWSMEPSQQLRVLNFPKVVGALLRLKAKNEPLQDGVASAWIDGKPLTVRVCRGGVEVAEDAPQEAQRMTAMEAQEKLFSQLAVYDGAMGERGWFPLPLYLCSADCF